MSIRLISLISALFLVGGCSSRSQDFSKYSHFIYGITSAKSTSSGVFFLVKRDTTIYFVTAAHVVNGWNPISNEPEANWTDTLFLRFITQNGDFKFLRISTKKIREEAVKQPYYKTPDFYIARISLPSDIVVESLDSLMDTSNSKINPVSTFFYGFPGRKYHSIQEMQQLSPVETFGTPYSDLRAPIRLSQGGIDYINIYFSMDNAATTGFSGAPVFLKDANGTPCFGGICFGGTETTHLALVVRPNFIINATRKNPDSIPYLLVFE